MKRFNGSIIRLSSGIAILYFFLSIMTGCQKSDMYNSDGDTGGSKGPGANEVFIQNMAFNPATITVNADTTITWTNKDGVAHTVTSSTGLFDSGSIGNNGTFSYTFTTAGTYPYYCAIHPSMTATVKVN